MASKLRGAAEDTLRSLERSGTAQKTRDSQMNAAQMQDDQMTGHIPGFENPSITRREGIRRSQQNLEIDGPRQSNYGDE